MLSLTLSVALASWPSTQGLPGVADLDAPKLLAEVELAFTGQVLSCEAQVSGGIVGGGLTSSTCLVHVHSEGVGSVASGRVHVFFDRILGLGGHGLEGKEVLVLAHSRRWLCETSACSDNRHFRQHPYHEDAVVLAVHDALFYVDEAGGVRDVEGGSHLPSWFPTNESLDGLLDVVRQEHAEQRGGEPMEILGVREGS